MTALWSWGLVLTSATQLRIPGLPVGAGELLLLIAAVRSSLARTCGAGPPWNDLTRGQFNLVVFGTFAMVLGTLRAAWGGHMDSLHDLLAFPFAGGVAVAFQLEADREALDPWEVMETFSRHLAIIVVFLYVGAQISESLGPIDPYLKGVRFRGWCENPNQLGLYLLPGPFALLGRIEHLRGLITRATRYGLVAAIVFVGFSTQSEALELAWFVGVSVIALQRAYSGWMKLIPASGDRRMQTWTMRLSFIALLSAISLVALSIAFQFLLATAERGAQGFIRLMLWKNQTIAFLQAPVLGWGSGHHSGLLRPHLGVESHNSLLNWLGATGLVGACVALPYWRAVVSALRSSKSQMPAASIAALAAFSMLHTTYRQPLSWLFVLGIVASIRAQARKHRSPRSRRCTDY